MQGLEHLESAKSLLDALTREKKLNEEVAEKTNMILDNCLTALKLTSEQIRTPATAHTLDNIMRIIDCVEKLHKVYQ